MALKLLTLQPTAIDGEKRNQALQPLDGSRAMKTTRATRHTNVLEAGQPRQVSRDTLLPWADPYIADLQRVDGPAAAWPDRPHLERRSVRDESRHVGRVRAEAAPPLGEIPLSRSDEGGRRS